MSLNEITQINREKKIKMEFLLQENLQLKESVKEFQCLLQINKQALAL